MAETKKKTAKRKPTKEDKERIKAEAERRQQELARKKEIKDEIISVLIIALGVFLIVSMHLNTTGAVGESIRNTLKWLFGIISYGLPYYLIVYGILNFAQKTSYISWRSVAAFCGLFVIVSIAFKQGIVGGSVNGWVEPTIGSTGVYIACAAVAVICLIFLINTPISKLFDSIKIKARARREATEAAMAALEAQAEAEEQVSIDTIKEEIAQKKKVDEVKEIESIKEAPEIPETTLPKLAIPDDFAELENMDAPEEPAREFTPEDIGLHSAETTDNRQQILDYVTDENLFGENKETKATGFGLYGDELPATPSESADAPAEKKNVMFPEDNYSVHKEGSKYKLPPLTLLNKNKGGKHSEDIQSKAQDLENTLRSFGVDAVVSNVTQGPAVTRFEVTPAPGVKVSKITSLHDDIALNLRARSLRIEAPIPGKAAVGIEISNDSIDTVCIREIIESAEFKNAKSKISMALGRSISGTPIVADMKEMPHLLIAGSTGSGKSVCINSILISFMYKASPDELKLILIDPKVVELSIYNGIPHLLIPVVTEPPKASAALGWAVTEMEARYRKFAEENVRDLKSYNETVKANHEDDKALPQIVIVIDELHDLMLAAQNQIEGYIARLAAKARAAGIHLIIATQRPSVDVITGVIKNNINSRIAFAVTSATDSRTILDMGGAEHLLGKGDMLYSPQGMDKPLRVQGCFVDDSEVLKVIEYVKKNAGTAEYSEAVEQALDKTGASAAEGDDDGDELLTEAIEFVVNSDAASVSSLQRRFRIGYNRAARIIDIMEERGIVGPADGSRPRKVLMTPEQFSAAQAASKEAEE